MVTLFDDRERTELRPCREHEPLFSYLNMSARLEAIDIRNSLEAWFARYPELHKQEFCGQFRSEKDQQCVSAFFELLVHEVLRRLGYTVEVHPVLQGVPARPDFLVSKCGVQLFYLEAISPDYSSGMSGSPLIDEIKDELNKTLSPRFWLSCKYSGYPTRLAKMSNVRKEIESWLCTLDYELLAVQLHAERDQSRVCIPCRTWNINGMGITIKPYPRNLNAGDPVGSRPILFWTDGTVKLVDTKSAVQRTLGEKAGKYGNLGLPLVVAVNDLNPFSGPEMTFEALFGSIQLEATLLSTGETYRRYTRAEDGAWDPKKHRAVSALLFYYRATPWNFVNDPTLICLPYCTHPFGELLPMRSLVPRLNSDGPEVTWDTHEYSRTLHQILDLSGGLI